MQRHSISTLDDNKNQIAAICGDIETSCCCVDVEMVDLTIKDSPDEGSSETMDTGIYEMSTEDGEVVQLTSISSSHLSFDHEDHDAAPLATKQHPDYVLLAFVTALSMANFVPLSCRSCRHYYRHRHSFALLPRSD